MSSAIEARRAIEGSGRLREVLDIYQREALDGDHRMGDQAYREGSAGILAGADVGSGPLLRAKEAPPPAKLTRAQPRSSPIPRQAYLPSCREGVFSATQLPVLHVLGHSGEV